MGPCLQNVIELILSNINWYMAEIEEYDLIIVLSEMFELYLGILENFAKNKPEETKEYFN